MDIVQSDDNVTEPSASIGSALDDRALSVDDLAQSSGDISHMLDVATLVTLGYDVVSDYQTDRGSRAEWEDKVTKALKVAAQSSGDPKTFPWDGASDVKYPLLTVAANQFAARAYAAIVKGDQIVGVNVLGQEPKEPELPPAPPPPQPTRNPDQDAHLAQGFQHAQALYQQHTAPIIAQYQQAVQRHKDRVGRAARIKQWLNYRVMYGMPDWETDTDALLHQLPIVGMAFKKIYYDEDSGICSDFVPALRLTVHMATKDIQRAPRITHDFELYPYEIEQKQRQGLYREDVALTRSSDDDQEARTILEQHCLRDLDGDGLEEPYVITVDEKTREVLRVEAAFNAADVIKDPNTGMVVRINRWVPFIEFPFLPDPQGHYYGIGFGHLLGPLGDVVNTIINQQLDAGSAQNAGGGFIAAGLRLQGAGMTNNVTFRPGEYKVVQAAGTTLREAIYERTFPSPSPVLQSMLELILKAAQDVSSVKDVLTGQAPATAPVGTTMAMIDQGLQEFSAIYKRIYRSLKREYRLLYEAEKRWGVQIGSPKTYLEVLDDPDADFEKDFSGTGHDIVPVSDPSVVTRAQEVAKAQAIMQIAESPIGQAAQMDPKEVVNRLFEAMGIPNAAGVFAKPQPPNPMQIAELQAKQAGAAKNHAEAQHLQAKTGSIVADQFSKGIEDGQGLVPGMAGASGDQMGSPSPPQGG